MADLKIVASSLQQVSTTQLLDKILESAVAANASDIHIEPQEDGFRIRFRIDGVLQEVVKLPLENYHNLLSRIKLLARINLNVSDRPQDGRFTLTILNRHFDFRVATLPLVHGESLVLRLLEQKARFFTLSELGFHSKIEQAIEEAIRRPTGMILTTGPTGSGKTTTLYALLNELNRPDVKIITLEDPIEYKLPGLVQSQVSHKEGFGFAEALKGALRSDPDIIMVGEIRDLETAEIALQAALTGHLVLSTFHANNAPATLLRLVEIGVKPHLLSGSINLIIAQRLVRKVCQNCKELKPVDQNIVNYLKSHFPKLAIPKALYRGKGCDQCAGTGYKGRTAIGEILIPTPELENLLIQRASSLTVVQYARQINPWTLEYDGILKALEGVTTLEEVFRVAKE